MDIEERVKKNEEKIDSITERLAEINGKLDKLLIVDNMKNGEYRLHRNECRDEFDERYVQQGYIRQYVIDILKHMRKEDIDENKNKAYLFSSILNIIYKISVPIGIAYLVVDKLL